MTPQQESERATALLAGAAVLRVTRPDEHHLRIEFVEGSELTVFSPASLQLSIYNEAD